MPMSFGIADNVKSRVVRTCTPELFHRALESQVVADVCAQIKDALEAVRRGEMSPEDFETLKGNLKKALIIFTFHATFKEGRRKNEDAIPSGLSIYDLDHIPNPLGKWQEIEPRKEELGIVLAHVTPSSEGLRLVFIVPQGMSLADAQAWMARQLGDDNYDACVKDYARCSFAVPREYVLFVDEENLFADDFLRHGLHGFHGPHPSPNEVFDHLDDTERYDKSVLSNQPEATKTESMEKPCNPCNPRQKEFPETFKGIPYDTIIGEWFRRNGGEPEPGERNTKLHRLASHLRYITDNNEEHLLQIMPNYGLKEEEMKQLIHHACTAKFYGMPKVMKKLLSDVESKSEEESELKTHHSELITPPEMPRRLPPLIRLLVSRTPKIYRPAVAHAVFPALATHLWRTTFRYIDNVEHEATLMNVLMAGTGAGKNCISEPINHILKDIRKRDMENLQREKEWKAEMNTKGANKDKRKRPEGLVIQEIDPDMTNAAFVQRLADAEERFLYTKMNEIDQFDALKTSARSKAHFQIMCLAFDPGNVYGQTRVGTSSVSERVCIRFNWNASTTIHKGQAYFRSVLTDGPISRINFCTIPEQPIGAEMPVYGSYGADFDEELRPYIERLNKARGLVECRQAQNLAKRLKEENAEFARLSQSRVYENLSFRANVIAYLKAMVLFVAQGGVWDKVTEDFIRWSLRYDMWCKMKFFGEAIEEVEFAGKRERKRGPQNLLDLLPDIFTRDEAQQMRNRQGIVGDGLNAMLITWKTRRYIEPYGEEQPDDPGRQQFIKTPEYLKKR
ncbi:MAG: VirE protein [Bacteroidaceae bacterium]|nr:VirE protein [Bacteroidaceae bacterium]